LRLATSLNAPAATGKDGVGAAKGPYRPSPAKRHGKSQFSKLRFWKYTARVARR